jgi:hypothetical protein
MPVKPLRCNAFTSFLERNWPPRPERTTLLGGFRSATALRGARTARRAFIRESME